MRQFHRRRQASALSRFWPGIVAVIVAVNLLLVARSVISRIPQGHIKVVNTTLNTSKKAAAEKDGSSSLSAIDAEIQAETERLAALRANTSLPLVYFDVEINGSSVGRIEMVLFIDIAPRAAENFRQFCTGEAGLVPEGREGAGLPYHYKGAPFYRIIDQFIDQSGVNVESVFGGAFKDDPAALLLKHSKKGMLSIAHMGPNTATCHFSIMMGPAHHLDGHHSIFGQVVSGFEAVDAVNALSVGKPDNTATAEAGARIADCGQLRKGTLTPDLTL